MFKPFTERVLTITYHDNSASLTRQIRMGNFIVALQYLAMYRNIDSAVYKDLDGSELVLI